MFKRLVLSFVFASLIPGMLFSYVPHYESADKHQMETVQTCPVTKPPQISVELIPEREEEPIYISVQENDGTVTDMELEKYVWGVVLGEMPASFELEALKAQAVAARTYALRCMEDGVHENGAVCKVYSCCQNYCDPKRYVASGGLQEYTQKVWDAVNQTKGVVATYGGKLIFSVYFASSGGSTEDAVEVWGSSFPYLKPVESPGETDKAYQNDVIRVTSSQFQDKLGIQLQGTPQQWLGKVQYTAGGGVDSVMIGGIEYSVQNYQDGDGICSDREQTSATGCFPARIFRHK